MGAIKYGENVALSGMDAVMQMFQVKHNTLVPAAFGIYKTPNLETETEPETGTETEPVYYEEAYALYVNNFGIYVWQGFSINGNKKYDAVVTGSPGTTLYISKISKPLSGYEDINVFLSDLSLHVLTDVDGLDAGKNYATIQSDGKCYFNNLEENGWYYVWMKSADMLSMLLAANLTVDLIPVLNPNDYFIFRVTDTTNPPPCNTCRGRGQIKSSTEPDSPYVKCSVCNGSGVDNSAVALEVHFVAEPSDMTNEYTYAMLELDKDEVCPTCGGSTKVSNPQVDCPICNGQGSLYTAEDGSAIACAVCHGTGKAYKDCDCVAQGFNGTKSIRNKCQIKDLSASTLQTLSAGASFGSYSGIVNIGRTTSSLENTPAVMVWTCAPNDSLAFTPPNPEMNNSLWSFEAQHASSGGSSGESGGGTGSGDGTNTECLAADTLITMADGTQRRIDSLSVGDEVLDKQGKANTIYRIGSGLFGPHTYYYFSDGTIINEVAKHRFYNVEQGFYQLMGLWNIGEHAINQNGELIELIKVEYGEGEKEQFGIFTVTGNYYANGLLSGQARCNTEFLADMTVEKAIDMLLSIDSEDGLLTALYEKRGVLQ